MKFKKIIPVLLFLLSILMIGAVSASSDTECIVSDGSSDIITQDNNNNDGVDVEKTSISENNNLKKIEKENNKKIETDTNNVLTKTDTSRKTDINTPNDEIRDNTVIDVNNWTELENVIKDNQGTLSINLKGDAVYYTQGNEIEIDSGKVVTINGDGHTIDAQQSSEQSIFYVDKAHLIIKNLKLTNGNRIAGGALFNYYGTITIINSTLTNNSADSLGGAIYNDFGRITIINSTLTNNTAPTGGAIYNLGTLTLTNTTLTNNTIYDIKEINIEGKIPFLTTQKFMTNISNAEEGKPTTINLTSIEETFNGNVEVNIINSTISQTITVKVIDGKGTGTINLPKGKYTTSISIINNGTITSLNTTFTVTKNPKIKIETIPNFEEGQEITLKITADSGFNSKLNININGVNYIVNVINGVGTQTIQPNLKPGTYNAIINYTGNENYSAKNIESNSFTVTAKTKPIIIPTKTTYKVKIYLTLKKVKKVSKNVKKLYLKIIVKSNGKKITTKNITLKVKTKSKKTTINTKKLKIQNIKFNIKINTKTYTKKTNKKGKATYTITNINNKGTYTAKISYKNKKYKKNNKNIKFKIK